MSYPDVWKVYLDNVKSTAENLKQFNEKCEFIIKPMWKIFNDIDQIVKLRGSVLPPYQQFTAIFFKRNIIYLQSAHILASMGFINPSQNVQRTVYETILRCYHFIVKNEEAVHYNSIIGTEKVDKYHIRKGASYLRKELYTSEMTEKQKVLYKELSVSVHPNIKGAWLDFPLYDKKRIEDMLKIILSLEYGNIQMMTESFIDILNLDLKKVIVVSMKEIATTLSTVPLFEPNKTKYSSRIKLKKGNFSTILST
jgi:hypothetical protein